jgi:hypothetical protein
MNYSATSKQFSGRLVTRKFTMNPSTINRENAMVADDDFTSAFMARKSSIAQIEVAGGGEMSDGEFINHKD